ncbi:MAG: fumarate hydratase C-terminal domain-containing protein [Anaerovoracaceae bacterium]|jgi:fumarate hydratase subunit beta
MVKRAAVPLTEELVSELRTGDMLELSGTIFTARDAAIPRLVELIERDALGDIDLRGGVVFHTAVSPAGVGPTSSNKLEIEGNMEPLSRAGIKMHLGKGAIGEDTVAMLAEQNAVYAVMPPVTALLESRILEREVAAFPELGMEALHRLKVEKFPVIIAAAHGTSIY